MKKYLSSFPLFQSHLDLSHQNWHYLLQPGDLVIDATCGNGHDTLFLCNTVLKDLSGSVWAIDIQMEAIKQTKLHLETHLDSRFLPFVQYHQGCHSEFPQAIQEGTISLITYNLGYLPGRNNKEFTTLKTTTLKSITKATSLLKAGGVLSLTCYPGHFEGEQEEIAILEWTRQLDPSLWSCCHHQWTNRKKSPSLFLIQKSSKSLKH